MKEWKVLISINLSLALLLGAVCPVAYAVEAPTDVLSVEEIAPVENEGDLYPAEEAGSETDEPELAPEVPEDPMPTEEVDVGEEIPAEAQEELQPEPEEEPPLQERLDSLSGTCGENTAWTLDEDGTLTISGTGDMKNYTVDSVPWYANRSDITKVVVEEGLTAIGDYVFSNCRNLTEVELNSSVLTAIGDYAFQNATALQTVIGSGTAAVTAIGDYAFYNCTALTGIDPFSGLERIGARAFQNCNSLTTITLPDSVNFMGKGAFYKCDGLTAVTLSAGMTEIPDEAFENCSYLATVTIPDSVTTIGSYAFAYCYQLKNLELPAGLETIGSHAFWCCSALQTVTIGNAVTTIGSSAFYSCRELQTVTIGSGIQTIGRSAFAYCSALQTITIDSYRMLVGASDAFDSSTTVLWKQADENTALKTWDIGTPTASNAQATLYGDGRLVVSGKGAVTSGGWINGNVNAVIVEDGITSIGDHAFFDMPNLKTVTIGDTVTIIGRFAFCACYGLKSVTIGKDIKVIDSYAFGDCSALETVTIDNYELLVSVGDNAFPSTAVVTYKSIDGEAEALQSWEIGAQDETDATATLYTDGRLVISGQGGIKIGGWNEDSIKAIEIQDGITSIPGSAFYEYTALESVQFGEGIESIPSHAFYGCTALQKITLPDSVTIIGEYAFYDCSALTSVYFSQNLTSIGYGAFRNCSALREVNLSDSVSTIGGTAFYNCQNLEILHLPESLTTIQSSAFANCSSLREVVIPDRVTTIGSSVFRSSASLEKLTIGQNVRSIGYEAFANCYGLKELHWNVPAYKTFDSTSAVFAAAGRDSGGFDLYLGECVQKIPSYLFYSSSSEPENEVNLLHVKNGSDCLQGVGDFAFYHCLNLESIELGEALSWIGDGSFNTCPRLTAITLPESLTSIGRKAFFRTALTEITAPVNLRYIGEDAFDQCGEGFSMTVMENSYAQDYATENNISVTVLPDTTVTLTLRGNHSVTDYWTSVKTAVGKVISLLSYSRNIQNEIYRYTSSANLVGWNTQPDGSGTAYETDAEITLEQPMELYAQWEAARMTIDGNTYPVDESCSGDGWAYEPGALHLDDYRGGSITVQGPLNLTVAGDCAINGQLSVNQLEVTLELGAELSVTAETEPAVKGTDVCLNGPGTFSASSSGPVCVDCSYFFCGGNLVKAELSASQKALIRKTVWGYEGDYRFYNDPVATQPASHYNGGPYLRMEHDVQVFTFHANGGTWKDQTGEEKNISHPKWTTFSLAELRDLISRTGYVLTGWMDANDDHDYPVNGIISAGNLTLYAQWTAADSFSVGGTSYRADRSASGTGWRFAPAQGENYAVLTLDSAYAGGEIYTAIPLQIEVNSAVSITAGIGKPGVEALQHLDIRVNSGSLTVTAGDGCDAVTAQGDVHVTADGALAARGGAGGLAIRSMGSVLLAGSNRITLTGGWNALAVEADENLDIRNTGDTYLIGTGWRAVSSGNLMLLDDGLKVYAGQNTSDVARVESLADAWGPFIHTKKKSVSVVLMANGGLLDGETMSVMELAESADNEIRLCAISPERKGYQFLGWNTKDDGSGIEYASNEIYQLSATQDKLTLFAQWEYTGFDVDSTGVTVRCAPPEETKMLLLALYDANGRLISTTVGHRLDESMWRFDSKFAETCSSMKVIALDEGWRPLMPAMLYQNESYYSNSLN